MLTALVAVTLAAISDNHFSVTRLTPLPGYQSFTPLFLNQSGTVVGVNDSFGNKQVSLWRNGKHEVLPDLPGEVTVKGLSNRGVTALNLWSFTGNKAILYANGRYSSLPPIDKSAPNIVGLNDAGMVLVTTDSACLVWNGRKYVAIDKSGQTFPSAVNNRGLVTGVTRAFDPAKLLGFTWQEGEAIKSLGEGNGYGSGMSVLRLNDADQILVEYGGRSYLWERGQYVRIASAPHQVWAINNLGEMIGHTTGAGPFIIRLGQPVSLQSLLVGGQGWQLEYVAAINDDGWIIGTGTFYGQRHGFLLKPVP